MKKNLLISSFLLLSLWVKSQTHQLIPQPKKIELKKGFTRLQKGIVLDNRAGNAAFKGIQYLETTTTIFEFPKQKSAVNLRFETLKELGPSVYRISIDSLQIKVLSSSEIGFTLGAQTLSQIIQLYSPWNVPKLELEDEPAYGWRGLHVDVCRHFFDVASIKKMLRAMSFYKLNVFHWHLTDDQGWRIEIKKYPRLTEIGGFRKETVLGHNQARPPIRDGKPYGGYYTQEQIKEVVAFAQSLNIEIVPEIEMPGHAQAALAAYPHLGCTKKPVDVWTDWGVSTQIYEPSDTVFRFLKDVLDEVITLFPSQYIHIGGDEAFKDLWKASPYVQQKIKKLGLKDEHELQNWFITEIEKHVNAKGRQIIGWDEILEGGLAPNAAVMSWRGEKGGIQAAKMKHYVVMSPGNPLYLDNYQVKPEHESLAIGGLNSLEKVYQYHPTPDTLTSAERKYILGAQGNLWSEYINTPEQLEYMAFPRAMAIAELCWTPKSLKNYAQFVERAKTHRVWLQRLGIHYCSKAFE
jgi:hexosaminidase